MGQSIIDGAMNKWRMNLQAQGGKENFEQML